MHRWHLPRMQSSNLGSEICSLQRRHQKVIEESPAILLNEEIRQKLLDVAVKATKYLKYEGAGTFEFLADDQQNIYFMEMNTRLQVEHPVSEMVSGLDIIEWMIKVAERRKNFLLKIQSNLEVMQ